MHHDSIAPETLQPPAGGAGSWKESRSTAPPPAKSSETRRSRVIDYALLATARRLLLDDFYSDSPVLKHREHKTGSKLSHRTAFCGRMALPGETHHPLLHFPKSKRGKVGNLMHCGSIWACPMCGGKISTRRREILDRACQGRTVVMLTLTLRHTRAQNLETVKDRLLSSCHDFFRHSAAGKRFAAKWHIAGWTRGLEVTYGVNGWHAHLHIVIDLSCRLGDIDLDGFQAACSDRWGAIVGKLGGYASAGSGARITVEADPSYIAKLGFNEIGIIRSGGGWTLGAEMTRGSAKESREGMTPQGLLAIVLSGQTYAVEGLTIHPGRAGRLWLEYAAAFQGEYQLRSAGTMRGAMKAAGDKSDEELEQLETEFSLVMGKLTVEQYRVIIGNDAQGELDDLLGIGDAEKVVEFLKVFGVRFVPDVAYGGAGAAISKTGGEGERVAYQVEHFDLDTLTGSIETVYLTEREYWEKVNYESG